MTDKNTETTHKDFTGSLVGITETLLTLRARKIARRKRKQKERGPILEWLDAFLWAVVVVLLLNQYIVQAYQIPSGSMRETLIGGRNPYTNQLDKSDRIFVDKLTLGPELLPGAGKLSGFRRARRAEVIIFENPEYESPSLFHEIAQRILYMVSFSLIDLNRRNGSTAHQFLIKRLVAQDGEQVYFREGKLFILPPGFDEFIPEADFKTQLGLDYGDNLLLDEQYYDIMTASIKAQRLEREGLPVSQSLIEQASTRLESGLNPSISDYYENERLDAKLLRRLYPQNQAFSELDARYEQGQYIPEGWGLPLGDNRSNSLDGRFFGPVRIRDILGRALFIYWPLGRSGIIK